RLFISLVGALHPVEPPRLDPSAPQEYFKQQKALVARVCRRFCNVFRPSCFTVFFYNARLNRACRIPSDAFRDPREPRTPREPVDGLRFPEAMHGFTWLHDLPTRALLDNEPAVIFPPFPANRAQRPTTPGTFAQREQVVPEFTLGFRFCW